MQAKHSKEHTERRLPELEKWEGARNVSMLGAFAHGTVLTLRLRVACNMGVAAAELRIAPDGGEEHDLAFRFLSSAQGEDLYELTLDTAALCKNAAYGLFYYEILLLRGGDTLHSDSIDNVHFSLSHAPAARHRLLVYEREFHTPRWFRGGTMYHVFLDRFRRGAGEATLDREDRLEEDWENGVPQFALRPGDPLKNNVFFGGNLWGVIEKLDTLMEMGVTVLYLSPVFEAASNHRYDTADYERIDGLLGGEAAFDRLIEEAHRRGMRVLLDGVFNHTGDDSRYFDAYGRYKDGGAAEGKSARYRPWYSFSKDGKSYDCWWGVKILPRLNHKNEECRHYFTGPEGIAARWLRRGIDGWRLDVADELSDEFLDELRETVKRETAGEGLLIGEVWENAADKIAYGRRRRYFGGRQLDSVMNYPFRNAALAFVMRGDADAFVRTMTELYSSYPPECSGALMNLLGTHDTDRVLTVLGDADVEGMSNTELSSFRLSEEARARAVKRLKLASVLQFTVFGVPSIYYGDEAGLEGGRDPFCRMPYPWGREDRELMEHYRRLGLLRQAHPAFGGTFEILSSTDGAVLYERREEEDRVLIAVNCGAEEVRFSLPEGEWQMEDTHARVAGVWTLAPSSFAILETRGARKANRKRGKGREEA